MVHFEETYHQSIRISQSLVEDVRFNRSINLTPVKTCAGHICRVLDSNSNILNLLNSVQDKNPYMYSHPVNVAFISFAIGKWMNLNNSDLINLVLTGLLHDIGKAKIKDSLLNRPGKLTEGEMATVRSHPYLGYKILEGLGELEQEVLFGVLSHHERMDGTGYPGKLKDKEISLYGRIIAIADTYDAITATKCYHPKSSPFKAIEEIQECSFGCLDPMICQIFIHNIQNFYYGNTVRLNNEQVGEIIYVNPEERTRPLIRCENEFLNLTKERDIEIVEIL
ncbi:MAG TPA: HD-GYP domain-containing protein [Mobilitalea sp.]|nr:HD-GYP domain-containing protein [Mobilitalea sp.]